jgi:ribonuclease-3
MTSEPGAATSQGWPLRWLRERLDYVPADVRLFEAALTHRSASHRNNERLEFLGDAVLNLIVAERLYAAFPEATEGDLSRLRARLVSQEPLAAIAQEMLVGAELRLGSGELKTGGFRRESILSDALEALIGAIYLDRGLDAVRPVLARLLDERIRSSPDPEELKDAKTRLQELLQGRGLPLPVYVVESIEGEAHEQQFLVRCAVAALGQEARGSGSSRRRAEQEAAQRVFAQISGAGRD